MEKGINNVTNAWAWGMRIVVVVMVEDMKIVQHVMDVDSKIAMNASD